MYSKIPEVVLILNMISYGKYHLGLAKTGLNSEVVLNLSDLNSDILLYMLWPEQAKFITILLFDLQV